MDKWQCQQIVLEKRFQVCINNMFKEKTLHTIGKIKNEIQNLSTIGWMIAEGGYLNNIQTDALFSQNDKLVKFCENKRKEIREKMQDISISEFSNILSEIEVMI